MFAKVVNQTAKQLVVQQRPVSEKILNGRKLATYK